MRRSAGTIDGERGWALVSVLWVIAVLTLLLGAAQSLSYQGALHEHRAVIAAADDAALDAAVVRAALGITDSRVEQRWAVDGRPQRFWFDGRVFTITVQDEGGRIDLNAADVSVLGQLLVAAGEPRKHAGELADRIADWRQATTGLTGLRQTSDADYAAAGLGYRPRHAPFETVDELRLVLGMSDSLFAKIRPAVTVYSHHPFLDTTFAQRLALLAYYQGQADRVEAVLKMRNGTAPGIVPSGGRSFEITVIPPRPARARQAVILLTNSKTRPYLVLVWR